MEIILTKANTLETEALSDLALRSKAYWAYDKTFIEACREDLTITKHYIENNPTYVLKNKNEMLGFFSFDRKRGKLDFLYLDPSVIGMGIGKKLWVHVVTTAEGLNMTSFEIDSDPHAEAFYIKMGAKRIGEIESTVFKGRKLPLLKYEVKK
ncbi:GNAT family N-acetyltransferase [Sutcliffiella rhizosphaerae]|uniref:N-acetyltransferase domain-containing protein n=1 Tax=Sutcliffiella rhizosphaerae TaxID=2880967 RepID=A0ABN8A7Y0_9BACI|nr:GNAT family N-acetyltransferase [Sutcliffiella rhizosphaerae]CAG9621256.1 hypothetical protein BACCIP111883_02028 [Sutcliffiella rhizosphaerae]